MLEPRIKLTDLPAELLTQIFGYLDVRSKFLCRRVSKQWQCCLEDTCTDLWRHLELPPGFFTLDWKTNKVSAEDKRGLYAQSTDAVLQAVRNAKGGLTNLNLTTPDDDYWTLKLRVSPYRLDGLWTMVTTQPVSSTIKSLTIGTSNRWSMSVFWRNISNFQALERLHIDDPIKSFCPISICFSDTEPISQPEAIDLPPKLRRLTLSGHQGDWSQGFDLDDRPWHLRGYIEELCFDGCLYLRAADFHLFRNTLHTIEARNCDFNTEPGPNTQPGPNTRGPRVPLNRFSELRRLSLTHCIVELNGPLPDGLQVLSVDDCIIVQDFTEGKASGLESRQPLKVWHFSVDE